MMERRHEHRAKVESWEAELPEEVNIVSGVFYAFLLSLLFWVIIGIVLWLIL